MKKKGFFFLKTPLLGISLTKLFFQESFQPNSFDHQLSGWEEYFPLWCTDGNCLPCPLYLHRVLYSFYYFLEFVILGWQRFLVSCAQELKYVNMYLGQLQWPCLVVVFSFLNLKLFITTLKERKKKKKKLYVNLPKYSKENKLAIKFSFYIHLVLLSKIWNVLGKTLNLNYRCRNYSGTFSFFQILLL